MHVKIDTRERFHVITILESPLHANMTEYLGKILEDHLRSDVKNVIIDLSKVTKMDLEMANALCALQQRHYENQASLVICCLDKELEDWLDREGLLELMNVTPTLSEAMDIVQMEEMEREMFED